jgi:hypothetical protein
VEGVEQEMRVELHLQRLETGLGQVTFQLGGAELTILGFTIVIQSVRRGQNYPVDQHIKVEGFDQEQLKGFLETRWLVGPPSLDLRDPPP